MSRVKIITLKYKVLTVRASVHYSKHGVSCNESLKRYSTARLNISINKCRQNELIQLHVSMEGVVLFCQIPFVVHWLCCCCIEPILTALKLISTILYISQQKKKSPRQRAEYGHKPITIKAIGPSTVPCRTPFSRESHFAVAGQQRDAFWPCLLHIDLDFSDMFRLSNLHPPEVIPY